MLLRVEETKETKYQNKTSDSLFPSLSCNNYEGFKRIFDQNPQAAHELHPESRENPLAHLLAREELALEGDGPVLPEVVKLLVNSAPSVNCSQQEGIWHLPPLFWVDYINGFGCSHLVLNETLAIVQRQMPSIMKELNLAVTTNFIFLCLTLARHYEISPYKDLVLSEKYREYANLSRLIIRDPEHHLVIDLFTLLFFSNKKSEQIATELTSILKEQAKLCPPEFLKKQLKYLADLCHAYHKTKTCMPLYEYVIALESAEKVNNQQLRIIIDCYKKLYAYYPPDHYSKITQRVHNLYKKRLPSKTASEEVQLHLDLYQLYKSIGYQGNANNMLPVAKPLVLTFAGEVGATKKIIDEINDQIERSTLSSHFLSTLQNRVALQLAGNIISEDFFNLLSIELRRYKEGYSESFTIALKLVEKTIEVSDSTNVVIKICQIFLQTIKYNYNYTKDLNDCVINLCNKHLTLDDLLNNPELLQANLQIIGGYRPYQADKALEFIQGHLSKIKKDDPRAKTLINQFLRFHYTVFTIEYRGSLNMQSWQPFLEEASRLIPEQWCYLANAYFSYAIDLIKREDLAAAASAFRRTIGFCKDKDYDLSKMFLFYIKDRCIAFRHFDLAKITLEAVSKVLNADDKQNSAEYELLAFVLRNLSLPIGSELPKLPDCTVENTVGSITIDISYYANEMWDIRNYPLAAVLYARYWVLTSRDTSNLHSSAYDLIAESGIRLALCYYMVDQLEMAKKTMADVLMKLSTHCNCAKILKGEIEGLPEEIRADASTAFQQQFLGLDKIDAKVSPLTDRKSEQSVAGKRGSAAVSNAATESKHGSAAVSDKGSGSKRGRSAVSDEPAESNEPAQKKAHTIAASTLFSPAVAQENKSTPTKIPSSKSTTKPMEIEPTSTPPPAPG